MFTLAENVAHNLCNSNNTAPSIGIIRVTIDAANGIVGHLRLSYWDGTEWITRLFVSRAKEEDPVRIRHNYTLPLIKTFFYIIIIRYL